MKYLMLCVTALVFSLNFTSCSNDDGLSPDGKRLVSKIKSYYYNEDYEEEEEGDGYIFSYDKSGRITAVEWRFWEDKQYVERWTYSVTGKKLTVKEGWNDDEEAEERTFVLNDKGFVVSEEREDEGNIITYTYYYDAEDYLTRVKGVSNNDDHRWVENYVWNDGDLVGNDGYRYTYYDKENKANIDLLWICKEEPPLFSLGYLGKMNKHLCRSRTYDGDYTYRYDYSFDKDGYVTKITETESSRYGREYERYYEIEYK